ncbi:MAG: tRNA threonylcarbamoyladenosine dehydratase [Cephaloticoccus sp.]|nr:tRNA threonylcarbamoyladenosine dehydratase [Cephaloticoccus sp.]MCF7759118.1 tRNA threonylcarbamoyladenosine dehydratase [Cephaloticoccus sp.]
MFSLRLHKWRTESESQHMNEDYVARFGGIGRLFGREALARLSAAHVCVVGVGGVGSWTVEGLARSGVGALTLIDLDEVCLTNVNRQLPALDGQIGRPKVDVLAERVRLINPGCQVAVQGEYLTGASAEKLLRPNFSFVVDAIDSVTNKAILIAESHRRKLPVLTIGGAGGKRDATQIRSGDLGEAWGDELLRLLRRKLRQEHAYPAGPQKGRMQFGVRCIWSSEPQIYPWADGTCHAEAEPGSNLKLDCASGFGTGVFVTGAFGLAAAGEVVRVLAGESGLLGYS